MKTQDIVFKAIAHPARRRMLELLSGSALSVKELTAEFAMSQPAVSQHLRELRHARLVRPERVGVVQRYRLTPGPLRTVFEWSGQYRAFFDPAGHAWAFTAASPQRDAEPQKKGGKRDGRARLSARDGRGGTASGGA